MTPTNDGDKIIDEIHRTRRQIADKFDGDITAILDDARKRQATAGRPVWQGKTPGTALPPSEVVPLAPTANEQNATKP